MISQGGLRRFFRSIAARMRSRMGLTAVGFLASAALYVTAAVYGSPQVWHSVLEHFLLLLAAAFGIALIERIFLLGELRDQIQEAATKGFQEASDLLRDGQNAGVNAMFLDPSIGAGQTVFTGVPRLTTVSETGSITMRVRWIVISERFRAEATRTCCSATSFAISG